MRFAFEGGFLDGGSIGSDDELGERYAFLSSHGRVGAIFRDIPPDRAEEKSRLIKEFEIAYQDVEPTQEEFLAFAKRRRSLAYQIYEVVEREEHCEETLVRVRFVREDDPT